MILASMHSSSSVARVDQDRRLRGAYAAGWPGLSGRPRSGSEESPLVRLASVVSMLEAAARIQQEATEVLRDLAARTGDQAAIQRLSRVKEPSQRLAGVRHDLSAQRGGTERQPRPAVGGQGRRSWLAEPLTQQEQAVLRLLATGLSLREIGRELYVSLNTVKSHTRAIYRKLDVSNRDDAVHRGRQLGISRANSQPA
jgi:ATP/maltotriose-dependent transcriptional regulator MalT